MKKEKIWRFIRYGIVGSLAILVYYTLLYSLTEILGIWYIVSASLATIFSFLLNFTLHKFWTFNNYDLTAVPKQLTWYTVMKIGLALANLALLFGLVDGLGFHYLIASGTLTVALSIVSYLLTHQIFK